MKRAFPKQSGRHKTKFRSVLMNPNVVMQPRQQFFRTTGAKRPTDKNLVSILLSGVDGTQQNTTMTTVTFPCTIVGIRWMLAVGQFGGSGLSENYWCINVLRDGGTQKAISTSNGSTFFAPESDCLVYGTSLIDNHADTKIFEGSTKTMRKMMGGDKLIFSTVGEATNTTVVRGVIQFFCKT